jgi:hypothetical protein
VTNVVPFGKYRGQPVEMLTADRDYCDWLIGQGWFRDRYANVYTLIINNFAAPSQTPKHNALQARFLDQGEQRRILVALQWQPVADPTGFIRNTISYNEKWAPHYPGNREDLAKARAAEAAPGDEALGPDITVEFEVGGWDVAITAKTHWDSRRVFIELKPSLGDDFPAVLRQMKTNARGGHGDSSKVLAFDKFAATGATGDQVRAIFAASGFAMLSLYEIAVAASRSCPAAVGQ